MVCQVCHKKEADQYYLGNWNGAIFLTGMCPDCAQNIENAAARSGHEGVFRRMTGIFPGKAVPRADGNTAFPERADAGFLHKVKLNERKAQLAEAAEREDYQEAARLRDEIEKMEQEESYYES